MDPIRVVIVDDSDFVREGMKIILDVDDDFTVLGCAPNGEVAVTLAQELNPDVILMDLQMPLMDGIEATRQIVEKNCGKVLILTTFDDYDLVKKSIENGAKGYLIKNHTPDQLKQMIKSIHNGVNVLDDSIFQKLPQHGIHAASEFDASPYTTREVEIIKAVSEGLSNKEISAKLYISEGTVKNYISTILEKGDLSHRTQLAVYYLTGKKNK